MSAMLNKCELDIGCHERLLMAESSSWHFAENGAILIFTRGSSNVAVPSLMVKDYNFQHRTQDCSGHDYQAR